MKRYEPFYLKFAILQVISQFYQTLSRFYLAQVFECKNCHLFSFIEATPNTTPLPFCTPPAALGTVFVAWNRGSFLANIFVVILYGYLYMIVRQYQKQVKFRNYRLEGVFRSAILIKIHLAIILSSVAVSSKH